MKKYILCFLVYVLGIGHAWSDNVLTVSDVTLPRSGAATIDIGCSFDTRFLGYQLDVELAEGLELVEDADGNVVAENGFTGTDHSIRCQKKANHTYRFIVVSMSEKSLPVSGSLLKVYARLEEGADLQGQVAAKVKAAKFTTTDYDEMPLGDVSFHINVVADKAGQSLGLTALPSMTYGDADYTLPETTDEGLPLTWASSNASVATVSGNTLTIVGTGTAVITASQAGNDSYLPFSREYQLTVTEKPEAIDVTDVSQMDNAIYVEPFTARVGDDVNIDICLKNAEAATAYVFDLVLPDGITVALDNKGKYIDALSDRHDDHTRTFNYKGNNTYSMSTLSGNSEPLTGNDGAIRLLTLLVADNVAEGVYAIDIKNASYSKPDGALIELPNTTSSVTVEDYMLGDVNGNGQIDIGDAVSIVNFLVGKESLTFVEKVADTNKNGKVDIGDAVTIVNFLVGKTASLSRQANIDWDDKEPQ